MARPIIRNFNRDPAVCSPEGGGEVWRVGRVIFSLEALNRRAAQSAQSPRG
jgi:hypothetical protein